MPAKRRSPRQHNWAELVKKAQELVIQKQEVSYPLFKEALDIGPGVATNVLRLLEEGKIIARDKRRWVVLVAEDGVTRRAPPPPPPAKAAPKKSAARVTTPKPIDVGRHSEAEKYAFLRQVAGACPAKSTARSHILEVIHDLEHTAKTRSILATLS